LRKNRRTICFITGTRAEFGLMESTLRQIQKRCHLQIVATGMHLSAKHGNSLSAIRKAGWKINAIVPWKASDRAGALAESTGLAIANLSRVFANLKPDIVLVVGDRVEAFAAATAAHLTGIPIAHVHGGDRALGQVDDSLRHAITKLSHIHFPATQKSAERIKKLGEDPWRIHCVGSPGVDGIVSLANQISEVQVLKIAGTQRVPESKTVPGLIESRLLDFALIVLHPVEANDRTEFSRAQTIYKTARALFPKLVIVYPNNDPGHAGILKCWQSHANDPNVMFHPNIPRANFLALLRDAAILIGNSSSGIIEAASFGTPVLDIGPRQQGREHGPNVFHTDYSAPVIVRAIKKCLRVSRFPRANIYGHGATSKKIAAKLATIELTEQLRCKLIKY
jgi:UDP-N-acetylglucosamine 2-epimerase (non-hydrolysing)/GDP/UDP-N,N'-diacetylbacillosamine 2-epimerase (hydrolysing)